MSDSGISQKFARIDNGVATVNRLVISVMASISGIPQSLDEFIRNPDEETVNEIEKKFGDCTNALEAIRAYLSQIAADVLDIEPETDVTGAIHIAAVDDGEGVRLQ